MRGSAQGRLPSPGLPATFTLLKCSLGAACAVQVEPTATAIASTRAARIRRGAPATGRTLPIGVTQGTHLPVFRASWRNDGQPPRAPAPAGVFQRYRKPSRVTATTSAFPSPSTSPTAGEASSHPPVSWGQPRGSDPSWRKACRTSPDDPATTSACPSPPTSATAGAVGICQPSIGIGNDGSQLPLAASQPPTRGSNGSLFAGEDWAAA